MSYACRVASAFFLAVFSLFAQTGVGSLTGQVLDPAGAVVPGAAVIIQHYATGRELRTITSDAGVYTFPTLDIGSYVVTAEARGFKKSIHSGVVIQAANRSSLEMRLEVGEVS